MKKKFQPLLNLGFIAATITVLSSCFYGDYPVDPYDVNISRQQENLYYIPAAPNAPLNTEKGEGSFSLMGSSAKSYSGLEFQASYMAGKHFGLMGGYSNLSTNGSLNYVRSNQFELGAGYVKQFSNNWHYEIYGGFGTGSIKNTHHTGTSNIATSHFFIQPSIAVSNKDKKVQFGFVSKFAGVNLNVTDTLFSTDRERYSAAQLKSLYDQPFHVLWEPGFVFRVGWKNLQFYSGISLSTDLTNPDLQRENSNFSVGICLRFKSEKKPETINKEKQTEK